MYIDSPIISIIFPVPVYNVESFVGDAINSILLQIFLDFELLIIEEAPSDQSVKVIQTFKDKRIKLYRNIQGLGSYSSRNIGLQKARGKYIAIMGAGDIAMPERLNMQYAYLENHPDILAVSCQYGSPDQSFEKIKPLTYGQISTDILNHNWLLHSSLLIRADIVRQIGGYDERYAPEEHKRKKEYTDLIRKKHQIACINAYKKKEIEDVGTNEVGHPQMGEVIALYILEQQYPENGFADKADKLLDKIFANVSPSTPVCIENGLLGIGCGLIWLLRNKFVDGNEDDVISEIDRSLIHHLIHGLNSPDIDWAGWLSYLRIRISGDGHKDVCRELQNKQHLIYMLDCLERATSPDKVQENIRVELLQLHHSCICPTKTEKLLCQGNADFDTKSISFPSVSSAGITFCIPVRIDSTERERNLDFLIEYLSEIKQAHVMILEADKRRLYHVKKDKKNISYTFLVDTDPIFHRTKFINELLLSAPTEIVGVWDTDVILPIDQINDAAESIRTGKAIMSFPYDGRFLMLSDDESVQFLEALSFSFLSENIPDFFMPHGAHSVGGAFFVRKSIYLEAGGENEHFYGWGPEDAERVKRMEILNLPVYRASGCLFHLYHPRMANSWFANEDIEIRNREEFLRICQYASAKDLWKHIKADDQNWGLNRTALSSKRWRKESSYQ